MFSKRFGWVSNTEVPKTSVNVKKLRTDVFATHNPSPESWSIVGFGRALDG